MQIPVLSVPMALSSKMGIALNVTKIFANSATRMALVRSANLAFSWTIKLISARRAQKDAMSVPMKTVVYCAILQSISDRDLLGDNAYVIRLKAGIKTTRILSTVNV
jgi:hypothetical protein